MQAMCGTPPAEWYRRMSMQAMCGTPPAEWYRRMSMQAMCGTPPAEWYRRMSMQAMLTADLQAKCRGREVDCHAPPPRFLLGFSPLTLVSMRPCARPWPSSL